MCNYYIEYENVTKSSIVESQCNAIAFLNQGTTTVNINGFELAPGLSDSNNGLNGETDSTIYNIRFVGVGTNRLVVKRKIYRGQSNQK